MGYHEPWEGILATDKQSLFDLVLSRGNKAGQSVIRDPSVPKNIAYIDVKGPERDIVSKILVVSASQLALKLKYVQGHQDRHVEYQHLSLLAQLMSMLTTRQRYQTSHVRQCPLVLLTDTAKVNLITPNGSITF